MVRLVYDADVDPVENLDEEALAWVVRLTSGVSTPQDHEAFRLWRDQSTEHAQALDRARTLWSQLGSALPEAERRRSSGLSRRWVRKVAVGLPLAASVILSLGGGLQYWRVWRFDAVTRPGERRVVALSDGSVVLLAGDSALKLDFTPEVRRLELARGEALFRVRHDARRPFVVHAGAVQVRDVGTVFEIARTGEDARIVVSEGVVEASNDDRRVTLTADQAMAVTSRRLGAVQSVDADMETAWSRGRLILDDKPLGYIVEALTPFYPGRIILLNHAAARQRLSAAIELDRIDDWLGALAKSHVVHLYRAGPLSVLR